MRQFTLTFIAIILFINYSFSQSGNKYKTKHQMKQKEIYFAGGCFWGTEHFFKQIHGVISTTSGYANGSMKNPTYQDVCSETTGFAETVKVTYDPETVELELLIDLFFKTIDPTVDKKDESVIKKALTELQKKHSEKIYIENEPLKNFYNAETYHQDYLEKNKNGYCHIHPELFELARKANPKKTTKTYKKRTDADLKQILNEIQYNVTQRNATEPPFSNEYWDEFEEGIYVDITTGEPLFISTDKFESGCGWPSFSKPIDNKLIEEKKDLSKKKEDCDIVSIVLL